MSFTFRVAGLALAALATCAGAVPTTGIRGDPGAQSAAVVGAADEKLRTGHEALSKRDYAGAEKAYREAMALARSSAAPLLALAELARVQGNANDVKRWLDQAQQVAPRDAQVAAAVGRWHYARRDYAKAEQSWRTAVAADGRAVSPLIDLGDLHFTVYGKAKEAGEFYRRAIALQPGHGGAHYALGMVWLQTGEPAKARAEFDEAARLSPGNPLPLLALGKVHATVGDHAAAIAAYDRVVQAHPKLVVARLDRGDALLAAGRLEPALQDFREAAAAAPDMAAVHEKTGIALQGLRRHAEAVKEYQTALKLDPKLPVALNNLAWLAAEEGGSADGGLAWARQAVSLSPDEPRFHGTLAWVRFKRGEKKEAAEALRSLALGKGAKVAETHHLLGVVLQDIGDSAGAEKALREALRLNPKFASAADAEARLKAIARR